MGHIQVARLIPASPIEVFRYITDLDESAESVSAFLNLEFPKELRLREGMEFEAHVSRFKFRVHFVGRVEEYRPHQRFTYRQVSGFFRAWSHTQTLRAHDANTTLLTDFVDFKLPLGIFGSIADDLIVSRDLGRILNERLMKVEEYFLSHRDLSL